jgi:voltage-gated potassium channel
MSQQRRHPALGNRLYAAGACGLLMVVYFLVPVEPGTGGVDAVVRLAMVIAGVAALALVIGRLVLRLAQARPGTRSASLLVALFGGLVLFALVDYMVAVAEPEQFVDLETKVDALYFAMSTLATVGYGDISASGQVARAVVTVQQLFNLAVIATGGTVLANQLVAARARAPR